MVLLYVLVAIVAGLGAVLLLWPTWGWGALLAAPFAGSFVAMMGALLLAGARR